MLQLIMIIQFLQWEGRQVFNYNFCFCIKGTGNNAIYYYGLDIRKNNQRVAEAFLDMRNPSNSISDISQQLSQTCTAVLNFRLLVTLLLQELKYLQMVTLIF